MKERRLLELWFGFAVFAVVAIPLSILALDGPVANFCERRLRLSALVDIAPSSSQIGTDLFVSGALVVLLCVLRRQFPKWAEVVLLSAAAAGLSFGLVEHFAKPLFSRPDPHFFVYNLRNHFGWRSPNLRYSAFPSTHAALAAAGLSVWGLYFPRHTIACFLCMAVIDVLLVIGGWHFISDVLAGNMFGFTIAALACATAWEARRRVTGG